jgi:hypothetical protein
MEGIKRQFKRIRSFFDNGKYWKIRKERIKAFLPRIRPSADLPFFSWTKRGVGCNMMQP